MVEIFESAFVPADASRAAPAIKHAQLHLLINISDPRGQVAAAMDGTDRWDLNFIFDQRL